MLRPSVMEPMQYIPHGMHCTLRMLRERQVKGGGCSKAPAEKGKSVGFLASLAPMRLAQAFATSAAACANSGNLRSLGQL